MPQFVQCARYQGYMCVFWNCMPIRFHRLLEFRVFSFTVRGLCFDLFLLFLLLTFMYIFVYISLQFSRFISYSLSCVGFVMLYFQPFLLPFAIYLFFLLILRLFLFLQFTSPCHVYILCFVFCASYIRYQSCQNLLYLGDAL